jgi:hypothetical protein
MFKVFGFGGRRGSAGHIFGVQNGFGEAIWVFGWMKGTGAED